MISDDFHKMVGVIFHIHFLKIGSMAVTIESLLFAFAQSQFI